MPPTLATYDGELIEGTVVSRPNRFVLEVEFDGSPERVFLGDPGALEVLDSGSTVLCHPVDNTDRKTDYDAVAVDAGEFYVSLRAAFANDLFEEALSRDLMPAFEGYSIERREPTYPDHGRGDFLLTSRGGREAYVEVKSCTHARDGVGKFPDRPTERGRRHLQSLDALCDGGMEAHLVFVAQRPDVARLEPYRKVDPEFADLLSTVIESGVDVHAMATEFRPPEYLLTDPSVDVRVE